MAKGDTQPVDELLAVAASAVVLAPGREPWNYGWYTEDYRRSERAALNSSRGPVAITDDGIAALESAVLKLLSDGKIRDRWGAEEFWSLVAVTAVVAASELCEEDRLAYIRDKISYWRDGGKALTIQLVANVTWERSPLLLGASVIGKADDEFVAFVNTSARSRLGLDPHLAMQWMENFVRPRGTANSSTPVAIACWTMGQNTKAFEETERQLSNIVDLTLLLERDLPGHGIYRRGDINRPGIRGLALDRGAIDRNLEQSAKLELVAPQFTITEAGDARSVRWFGAEPLPLGNLLDQIYLREAIQLCLRDDPISNRVRVAARWFAEAHYTLAEDDAALALGVALDALLTGKNSLSGSVMADRVAMLSDKPAERPKLVSNYLKFYGVRSSVAHGGRSSKLNNSEFMKEYRAFVQWAAWRSLTLRDRFSISSEAAVDDLYNDLRWGVRSWATRAD